MDDLRNRLKRRTPMQGIANAVGRFGKNLIKPGTVEDTDELDQLIKYNQLETGSPDFKMREAQTRADINLQSALDIEAAKKHRAQADYDAAVGSQPTTNVGPVAPPSSIRPNGPAVPQQYLEIKGAPKYDSSLGRMVPGESKFEKNLDYVPPQDREVQENKDNMLRGTIEQNLRSIEEAKKGEKYFGRMGDVPSWAAPSSIPVVGKALGGTLGVGDEYAERQKWENNINQLLSEKVVDLIANMKSQSKSGATGFGALNKTELDTLRNASTVLNKKLDGKDAMLYLDQIEQIERKLLAGLNGVGGQQIPTFNTLEEAEASGYKGPAIVGGVEGDLS